SPDVRAEAIRSTYLIAHSASGSGQEYDRKQLVVALSEALADPSEKVRFMAVSGPFLVLASTGYSRANRSLPVVSAPELIRVLKSDVSASVRGAAASTLGGAYPKHDAVIAALFDEADKNRDQLDLYRSCIWALSNCHPSQQSISFLIEQLGESHSPEV